MNVALVMASDPIEDGGARILLLKVKSLISLDAERVPLEQRFAPTVNDLSLLSHIAMNNPQPLWSCEERQRPYQ